MATPPQISSQKANCTRVVERFNADAFVVCRAGSIVAVHFYTRSGEVIVTTTEKEFVAKARGATDHNRNPWRALPDPEKREEQLAQEAAEVPRADVVRRVRRKRRSLEDVAKYALIQKEKEQGSPLNFSELCEKHSATYCAFMAWRSSEGFSVRRESRWGGIT